MDEDGGEDFGGTRYREVERTGLAGYFVATAYNLVPMANLLSPQQSRVPRAL